jgi:hypothetical protein
MKPQINPEAASMRRLRADRREAAGLPRDALAARLKRAAYLYRVVSLTDGARCLVKRDRWEGRLQVGGRTLVVARSVKKHGARGAYLQCVRQLEIWLLDAFPCDLVKPKIDRLLARAPEEHD